jgi:Regulator of chromosome condensation (RCC1) repeat
VLIFLGLAAAAAWSTPARAAAPHKAVWSWGGNENGELGRGATCASYGVPAPIPGGSNAVSVAAGEYFGVAVAGGRVSTWGINTSGQLGAGSASVIYPSCGARATAPLRIPGLTGVVMVAAGFDHALALKKNGTVNAWGDDTDDELGIPTPSNDCSCAAAPIKVRGLPQNVTAVAAGDGFSLALTKLGQLWAWGANDEGQLGLGSSVQTQSKPKRVRSLHGILAVSAGENHVLARDATGVVWSWGANENGELGNGIDCGYRLCFDTSPHKVRGLPPVQEIAAGGSNSAAIDAAGNLFTWGDNQDGQLGIGKGCVATTGENCVAGTPQPVSALQNVAAVSFAQCLECGTSHAVALTSDGTMWAWGDNTFHETERLARDTESTPVAVTGVQSPISTVLAGPDDSFAIFG